MDQTLSFISLAVADLDASRRFYLDGLGWGAELDVPDEVVMVRVGERLVLSLWARAAFEVEVGPVMSGDGAPPLTLAHNVPTRRDVDAALAEAAAAGAVVTAAQDRDWGGYTGYFADPDGFRWEVAWNPGPLGLMVVPDTQTD